MVIREQPFIQLFSSKEYSLFWLAALFSNIGMWALIYGRLWLMRTMTDSETLLGLVSSANLMPVLLFSIFGGVIADKYNRLKILQTTRLFLNSRDVSNGGAKGGNALNLTYCNYVVFHFCYISTHICSHI